MTEHSAGPGPRRQLIERVAAFVEKLPPRGLGLEEPCSPLFAAGPRGDSDVFGEPGTRDDDVFFDPPSVPMRAFTLSDGSFYGPGDRDCAGGLAVATLSVCQRDGIDVSDAVAAGEAAAAEGSAGDERFLEVALGVDAGTAESLARGSGTLRQWCPPQAVTGFQMATALRSAADGVWRHQVWSDALLEVAPGHHDGPTVDPTAFVDPQAFVARDVVVDRDAYVGGGAVLLAGTRVGPGCRVDDGAVVGPGTELGEGVWVGGDAHVRSARVGDGGVVEDRGLVLGAHLPPNSVVVERRIVGDFGDGVHAVPRTLPPGEISAPEPGPEPGSDPFPGALVLPGARVSERAFVAPGAVVCPGAVIGPHTHVGPGVVVGSGALVCEGVYLPGGTERTIVGTGAVVGAHAELANGAVVRSQGAVGVGRKLGPGEATSCSVVPPGCPHRLDGPALPLRTSRWERWQRYQSAGGASSDVPAALAGKPDYLVHPTAAVHPTARLSDDTVVGPYAVVGRDVVTRGPCDIRGGAVVGDGCDLSSVVVSHDVRVGAVCTLRNVTLGGASGLSGPARVGSYCRLTDTRIGSGAMLGDRCLALGAEVHASAQLGDSVMLGHGSSVGAMARLESHVRMASSSSVDRAALVGSWSSLRPGASVGAMVQLAAHCDLGERSSVGAYSRLGERARLAGGVALPESVDVAGGAVVRACRPGGELPEGVAPTTRVPLGAEAPPPAPGAVAAGASAAADRARDDPDRGGRLV